mmetsp:Transcript_17894/g.44747  ORF Transcript_17894/g.44747 Transcript_17894/m.44747 type:complete len:236 (+) Transcript_17894:142-849(+)
MCGGLVGNDVICVAVDDHQGPRGVLGAQLGQGRDPLIVRKGQGTRKARDRGDQVAGLGQEALGHHAPVGVAGDVDAGGVDGVRSRHLCHHLSQEPHVVRIVAHREFLPGDARGRRIYAASHALAPVREPVAFIARSGVPPGSNGSTCIPLKPTDSILADRLVLGLRPDRDEPKLLGLGEPARVELRVILRHTLVDGVQIDHERHDRLRSSDRCGHVRVPGARDSVVGDGGELGAL